MTLYSLRQPRLRHTDGCSEISPAGLTLTFQRGLSVGIRLSDTDAWQPQGQTTAADHASGPSAILSMAGCRFSNNRPR